MLLGIFLAIVSTFFVLGNTQAVCDLPGHGAIPCIEDDDGNQTMETCGPDHFACTDDDNETCDCPGLIQDEAGDCDPDLLSCVDDDGETCDCPRLNLGREEKSDGIVLTWWGFWGDWGSLEFCPKGSFVHGFQLKSEPSQGRGDDTALNAVRLSCNRDLAGAGVLTSSQAPWGVWGSAALCPSGSLVTGFSVKEEPRQGGGDDTALNNVRLSCGATVSIHASVRTSWGQWKDGLHCRAGWAVIGMKTRVERSRCGGDCTALNGLQLICGRD